MDERFVAHDDLTVSDNKTGLMWQRGASPDRMVWNDGFAYVEELNRIGYAGFKDWRYPSSEEGSTLLLKEDDRHSGLFVDPVFEGQRNIWTSTKGEHHRVCYLDFYYGDVYLIEENYANYHVRAVRTER